MKVSVSEEELLLIAKIAYTAIEVDADETGYPRIEQMFNMTTEEVSSLQDRLSFIVTELSPTEEV